MVSITVSGFILVINQAVNGFSDIAILNFFTAAGGVASHLVSFVLLFELSYPKV